MPELRDYGFNQWTITLNGTQLTDLAGTADAITFPSPELNLLGFTADGKGVASSTGMKGGPVNVKCTPGGQSDRYLAGLAEQIKSGMSIPMRLTARHNQTGEVVDCEDGVLSTATAGVQLGSGLPADTEYGFLFVSVTRKI